MSLRNIFLKLAHDVSRYPNIVQLTNTLDHGFKEVAAHIQDGGSEVEITPVYTSGEKLATVTVDDVDNDIYMPNGEVKTMTGDSFTTVNGSLVDEMKVGFTPIQDLHGCSKPWAGGAGKQKFHTDDIVTGSSSFSGTDKDFTISGTGTYQATGFLIDVTSGTNYTLTVGLGITSGTARIQVSTYDNSQALVTSSDYTTNQSKVTVSFNSASETKVRVKCYCTTSTNETGSVEFTDLLVRLSSIADDTWEPYSNICPISGHTQVQSKINNTTYTTSLGGTYYGGEVDQVGGTGEETKYNLTMSSKIWIASGSPNRYYIDITDGAPNQPYHYTNTEVADALCSMYKVYSRQELDNQSYGISLHYSVDRVYINVKDVDCADATAFNSKIIGQDLCYKLATPTALTLTGQNITAEVGVNNVSAPGANQEILEVKYHQMMTIQDVEKLIQ